MQNVVQCRCPPLHFRVRTQGGVETTSVQKIQVFGQSGEVFNVAEVGACRHCVIACVPGCLRVCGSACEGGGRKVGVGARAKVG